jgi:hypothetical protein
LHKLLKLAALPGAHFVITRILKPVQVRAQRSHLLLHGGSDAFVKALLLDVYPGSRFGGIGQTNIWREYYNFTHGCDKKLWHHGRPALLQTALY